MPMENSTINMVKEIYDQLGKDPRTRKTIVDIGFQRGIVVLTGNVKSQAEYQAVEEIVRKTPGVISVTNELKVG
jgi:osmotically-inducible protein OsmY